MLAGLVQTAEAHRQGESYIYLQIGEDSLTGRFEAQLS